jgi:hypothetical protein
MVRTSLARGRIQVRTPVLEQVKGRVQRGMDKCTRNWGADVVDSGPSALVPPVRRCWVQGMLTCYGHLQTQCVQMSYVPRLALQRNL